MNSVLSMSLKRYLFLLVALFVILLAGAQLIFIHYIQQQIGKEVEDKSRTLSEQALRIMVDNIPTIEQPDINHTLLVPKKEQAKQIVITVKNTPNKAIDLGDGIEFITGNKTKTVSIQSTPSAQVEFVKKRLQGQLAAIDFKQVEDTYAFAVENDTGKLPIQRFVQFRREESAINRYFNWLIGGTVVFTLLGIFFAYWLARHVSSPLKRLSDGFEYLEQGELGRQVLTEGIQEVQDTLQRFNQMSARLAELNQIETRYAQQQQMVELGEVARGLAHTLRNPINTIGLAIEQITQPDKSAQQRAELAVHVRQKISHLDKTIKALLQLTSHELTRDKRVNVSHIIQDVIMEVSMTDTVKIEFSAAQPLLIYAAEMEIRSIVHTLVTNAVEASSDGQTISIFVKQQQDSVTISVIDQGKGIPLHIKQELFKPHITSKPEGAGMGLYIARRLCQLHYQGDILLADNHPNGCVATATLVSQLPKSNQHD